LDPDLLVFDACFSRIHVEIFIREVEHGVAGAGAQEGGDGQKSE
jgi:hypothetical protein